MKAKEFKNGRIFMGRLAYDADLLEDILNFAREKKVKTAYFSALGAAKKVVLAYYQQEAKAYQELTFDRHMEIVSCFGNITSKDGKPHIHAHGVFADEQGQSLGGHIQPDTILFAGEIVLQELIGEELEREHDPVTGLFLWKI